VDPFWALTVHVYSSPGDAFATVIGDDVAKPVRVVPPVSLVHEASYRVTTGKAFTVVNGTVIDWLAPSEMVPIVGALGADKVTSSRTKPFSPRVLLQAPFSAPFPPLP
jgi:hypothetical protein